MDIFNMKCLIIAAAVLCIYSAGSGAYPDQYTARLLTEGDDPTVEICEASPAILTTVYIRLWINNDVSRGLKGFEMGIDFNSEDIISATRNPDIPLIIGDLATTAFAGAFQECRMNEWVWIAKYQDIYLGTPHMIETVANSDTGNYIVTSCESDFPQYPLNQGCSFGINIP
jgi:hypothetical protein